MTNKKIILSSLEMEKIKSELMLNKDVFFVEINGNECQCLDDYLYIIWKIFMFPIEKRSMDGYIDWICDLTWLDEDKKIIIVINNFSEFLKNDLKSRNIIIKDFEELILPWWETDVSEHVVGGKPRTFLVYLVD